MAREKPMLWRFSLYGFLKNQQYYDPFLLLAFRQMGVSYTAYGLLIAFREIMINLMEIPSGAVADLCGKRKSMILSFVAYIISFGTFGGAGLAAADGRLPYPALIGLLFAAMLFFAVGEAFRTGTHKAMIFTWLRLHDRIDERTRVYGYTRSWSKLGSAFSVVLACVFVFVSRNYIYIFFFASIPYVINIINVFGYPAEVDGETRSEVSIRDLVSHLRAALRAALRDHELRRVFAESMGFEGFFKAAKDYLQPILKVSAVALTARWLADANLSEEQESVILIGPVFFLLYLGSAVASRKAHALVERRGDEEATARWLWAALLLIFLAMLPGLWQAWHVLTITGFVALYLLQNLWRPVLISRIDAHSDERQGATLLSIESQAKSVATMIIAPVLGYVIDTAKARHWSVGPGGEFWPLGVFGAVLAAAFLVTGRRARSAAAAD